MKKLPLIMYNWVNEQTVDEMNNFICKDTEESGTSSYSRKLSVYFNYNLVQKLSRQLRKTVATSNLKPLSRVWQPNAQSSVWF